jgi:hypothetical protein
MRSRPVVPDARASAVGCAVPAPLASLPLPELEALAAGPCGPVPRGDHVGRFLQFIDSPGGRDPRYRALSTAMFRWPRFGVDFDRHLWWFGGSALALGRFRAAIGPSHWRSGEVVQLHYEPSRLPRATKARLYDEVKPLGDGRILGTGGIVDARGPLDLFFFELTPR